MRYPTIDILRTLAIFLMVLVHFSENLSGYVWTFAGFGAPHFALLTGLSYRIWLSSQERRGKSDEAIAKVTTRRGLFLIGLGLLFNVVVWMPEDVFNWDVLTLIGIAQLLLNWARRVPPLVLIVSCLLLFGLSPALRTLASYPEYWTEGYYDPNMTLSDTILGLLVTGYFPLFPWLLYPLVGFLIGGAIHDRPEVAERPWRQVALLGVVFLVVGQAALWFRDWLPVGWQDSFFTGWTMFPPTSEYVLTTVGTGLLTISLGHYWIDLNPKLPKESWWLSVATTFSRHSLTVYLLHHIAHVWPLWIYGAYTGSEQTELWRTVIPTSVAVALAALFLVANYFLLRWMERTGRGGAEQWMRWLCD